MRKGRWLQNRAGWIFTKQSSAQLISCLRRVVSIETYQFSVNSDQLRDSAAPLEVAGDMES